VDRELYIPRSWTCDPDRCQAAGLSKDTVFATKPELSRTVIERFLDAGHHVGWVKRLAERGWLTQTQAGRFMLADGPAGESSA
jgi:SRSO17 transposase